MVTLTSETFEQTVTDATTPILLLFATAASTKGFYLTKQLDALDPSKFSVFRINIDESPDIAMKFSIRESPMILRIEEGNVVASSQILTDTLTALEA